MNNFNNSPLVFRLYASCPWFLPFQTDSIIFAISSFFSPLVLLLLLLCVCRSKCSNRIAMLSRHKTLFQNFLLLSGKQAFGMNSRITPFSTPEAVLCDSEFFSVSFFSFYITLLHYWTHTYSHIHTLTVKCKKLYHWNMKRMFDLHLHMYSILECLKNVKAAFIRCITATAYRLTCTIICYLCCVALWFCCEFFFCSFSFLLETQSDSVRTEKIPDISNTNWVISNSLNSHISFSGVTFFEWLYCICVAFETYIHTQAFEQHSLGAFLFGAVCIVVCCFTTIENVILSK